MQEVQKQLLDNVLNIKSMLETKLSEESEQDILMALNPLEWTFTVNQNKKFKDAQLLVTAGGPTIYVNVADYLIVGYWGADKVEMSYNDNNNLYDIMSDLYSA